MIILINISCEYCGFSLDIPKIWKHEDNKYKCPKCNRLTPFKTISETGYYHH